MQHTMLVKVPKQYKRAAADSTNNGKDICKQTDLFCSLFMFSGYARDPDNATLGLDHLQNVNGLRQVWETLCLQFWMH